MATLQDILNRYRELCDYCDAFWGRVLARYPHAFACAPGCSTCCELPSVNYLEAYMVAGAVEKDEKKRPAGRRSHGPCAFLENDRCSIYAARPLICRTHGLPLKSEEYAYSLTLSCPYNFADVDTGAIDPALILPIDTVSHNLARLNAAFCLLEQGTVKNAGERVLLRDLAGGKVTRAALCRSAGNQS